MFFATLHLMGLRVRETLEELREQPDRGAISTETVVITIGLFIVAGLIVAGITAFANTQLGRLG